jgi:hypothetical protein
MCSLTFDGYPSSGWFYFNHLPTWHQWKRHRPRCKSDLSLEDSEIVFEQVFDFIRRSNRFLYFRRTRQKQNKFLDRTIQHEWIVDETSQQKEWYKGTVMSVISGNDGKLNGPVWPTVSQGQKLMC